ncbi:hypothetical protein [Bacillus cereus group sp. RP43]|uniref:hypothetical protein n=1 Tax=Bacillus cereus group sp. RP43 TaxID=3040260 RepID=UPI0033926618
MKKAMLVIIGAVSVIVFFIFVVNHMFGPEYERMSSEIKKEELAGESIKDVWSVVYFSTTADQDTGKGEGTSYAVFIDKDGKAKSMKMKGLELGKVAKSKGRVFLEEKDKIHIVGERHKEFKLEKEQHTGEYSGYLESEGVFFSIFNSGFTKNGKYSSDVYWGNEKGFKNDSIPYYIDSSNLVNDRIIMVTRNLENTKTDEYQLMEGKLSDNTLKISQLTEWKQPENIIMTTSSIEADENYYYLIISDMKDEKNMDVSLMRIDKNTLKREVFPFIQYTNVEELGPERPFSKKPMNIFEGSLYYIDGLGDVYTFDTRTTKVEKAFSFIDTDKSTKYFDEQIYFKDDKVYFFRYNHLKNKYMIQSYHLGTGRQEKNLEIKGLEKIKQDIKTKGKYAPSYDFIIVDDQ